MNADFIQYQAKNWLTLAKQYQTLSDKRKSNRVYNLLHDEQSKACLIALLDQSFRSKNAKRIHHQIKTIFNQYGIPKAFNPIERSLLWGLVQFGSVCPDTAVALFRWGLKQNTKDMVLSTEGRRLETHLKKRRDQGFKLNINLIGEEVLSQHDADEEFHSHMALLDHPDIDYISIKISAIVPRLTPLSFEHSVDILCERLAKMYQKANACSPPKFINLDMESYRDLRMTLSTFKRTLSQPEFHTTYAGIVIQTYLPDAHDVIEDLVQWAQNRVETGGSPIKVRIVKGANLDMERVDSDLNNLPVPVYSTKEEVDASFKTVLHYLVENNRMKAVHVGLGSQNVLDMSYCWELVKSHGCTDYFIFEMLEGMANDVALFLQKNVHQTLLYTPIVHPKNFYYALAYLFRRLDENTGKKNFLNYLAKLPDETASVTYLNGLFATSLDKMKTLRKSPVRTQNRQTETSTLTPEITPFKNEANTDFNLPHNLEWVRNAMAKWIDTPLVHPEKTDADELKTILTNAQTDPSGWNATSHAHREQILYSAATIIAQRRGDLIGLAAKETGKIAHEADVEISEAIDFARYYSQTAGEWLSQPDITVSPKGCIVVIAPWNFPIAIPLGGIFCALATGNTVIFKPAAQSSALGLAIAQCCWDAGVPKTALQLIHSSDSSVLKTLTASPIVSHIIFTGSTNTAYRIKASAPNTELSAETGGKNAYYISDLSDDDQAIKACIESAFSNSGQKCSACSILFVHKSKYHNPQFQSKLKDAVTTMRVGSQWDLATDIGPLVNEPSGELLQAMTECEGSSYWLLEPQLDPTNPKLMSPGIKYSVTPHDFSFKNELFGPILSVCCVDSIDHAIDWVNQGDYGLTSGIWTLDDAEQTKWANSVRAGNMYINRGITGAVVQRQPFGGMKKSCVGVGLKAGGPNYVSHCFKIQNATKSLSQHDIIQRYKVAATAMFQSHLHDPSHIYGEENILRYRPNPNTTYRIEPDDSIDSIELIITAAELANVTLTVSLNPDCPPSIQQRVQNSRHAIKIEPWKALASRLNSIERLRFTAPLTDDEKRTQIAGHHATIMDHIPSHNGRYELLFYLDEQSISRSYHRFGNTTQEKVKTTLKRKHTMTVA